MERAEEHCALSRYFVLLAAALLLITGRRCCVAQK
jgi:hypothetical protein